MKKSLMSAVALAAVVAFSGSAWADILIGVGGPITGPNAAFGAQIQKGVEQAAADINAAGGINGEQIKVVLGDDYGIIVLPHGRYMEELEFYVKNVGIPALDVIRWSTKNGGELLGGAVKTGMVKAGYYADLLVVDGDPSADIAVLQDKAKVRAILKGGSFVRDAL